MVIVREWWGHRDIPTDSATTSCWEQRAHCHVRDTMREGKFLVGVLSSSYAATTPELRPPSFSHARTTIVLNMLTIWPPTRYRSRRLQYVNRRPNCASVAFYTFTCTTLDERSASVVSTGPGVTGDGGLNSTAGGNNNNNNNNNGLLICRRLHRTAETGCLQCRLRPVA